MSKPTKKQLAERAEAIETLRKWCRPGTVVYTTVKQVARSGMSRHIAAYTVDPANSRVFEISGFVARALGWRQSDKTGGVVVAGCGMDMGFHLINALSYAIHGTKDVGLPDRTRPGIEKPEPHAYRAGYSLRHEWL